ncbi:MAG: hypothetical protein WCF12_16640 [Propionicimonas sp.]
MRRIVVVAVALACLLGASPAASAVDVSARPAPSKGLGCCF